MVNGFGKALCWGAVVLVLNSCQSPSVVVEEEPMPNVAPQPLVGEGYRFQTRQCRLGQQFESRYGDEARQELIVRYQGQEMTLRHHVHRDLVIYEGQRLALYSDGRVRQLVNAHNGNVLADGCL